MRHLTDIKKQFVDITDNINKKNVSNWGIAYRILGPGFFIHGEKCKVGKFYEAKTKENQIVVHSSLHHIVNLYELINSNDNNKRHYCRVRFDPDESSVNPKDGSVITPCIYIEKELTIEDLANIYNIKIYKHKETGQLHRIGGPALFYMNKNGVVQDQYWFNNGILHNANGPAVIKRFPNGNKRMKGYYVNGKKHRRCEDGPAFKIYIAKKRRVNGNKYLVKEYYENDLLHRDQRLGPAHICSITNSRKYYERGERILDPIIN